MCYTKANTTRRNKLKRMHWTYYYIFFRMMHENIEHTRTMQFAPITISKKIVFYLIFLR